jgi:hypothetical protein
MNRYVKLTIHFPVQLYLQSPKLFHGVYRDYISVPLNSTCTRRYTEEDDVQLHSFYTSALHSLEWSTSRTDSCKNLRCPLGTRLDVPRGRSRRFWWIETLTCRNSGPDIPLLVQVWNMHLTPREQRRLWVLENRLIWEISGHKEKPQFL